MSGKEGTFTGGCHCGAIKYSVKLPIPTPEAPLSATRCNCTFCQKLGMTNLHVKDPATTFKLLSPADRSSMADYNPNKTPAHKWFCRDCGTHVFMDGYYMHDGHRVDLFSINALSLDQPQEGLDLSQAKIKYFDMLTFSMKGSDKPFPGGLP